MEIFPGINYLFPWKYFQKYFHSEPKFVVYFGSILEWLNMCTISVVFHSASLAHSKDWWPCWASSCLFESVCEKCQLIFRLKTIIELPTSATASSFQFPPQLLSAHFYQDSPIKYLAKHCIIHTFTKLFMFSYFVFVNFLYYFYLFY